MNPITDKVVYNETITEVESESNPIPDEIVYNEEMS